MTPAILWIHHGTGDVMEAVNPKSGPLGTPLSSLPSDSCKKDCDKHSNILLAPRCLSFHPSLGLLNPMIEGAGCVCVGRGEQRYASFSLTPQGANGVGLATEGGRAAGAVGPGVGRAGGKQGRAGGCPGQGRARQGGQDGRGWVCSQPCLSKSLAPRRKSGNISSSNSGSSSRRRRRRRAGAAKGGRRLSPRGDVEGGEAACGAGRLSASPGLRVCALLHPSLHLSLPPISLPPSRPPAAAATAHRGSGSRPAPRRDAPPLLSRPRPRPHSPPFPNLHTAR